eukprot:scaffold1900_cov183-Ochromonas_danica.AAC.4
MKPNNSAGSMMLQLFDHDDDHGSNDKSRLFIAALRCLTLHLFLIWMFGRSIAWKEDLLWSSLSTSLFLLLPPAFGVDMTNRIFQRCLTVALLTSVVYLLDWQAWWQRWPLPTVASVAVTYTLSCCSCTAAFFFQRYFPHRMIDGDERKVK